MIPHWSIIPDMHSRTALMRNRGELPIIGFFEEGSLWYNREHAAHHHTQSHSSLANRLRDHRGRNMRPKLTQCKEKLYWAVAEPPIRSIRRHAALTMKQRKCRTHPLPRIEGKVQNQDQVSSGTRRRRPSSASVTRIWQLRREVLVSPKARSSMSSSSSLGGSRRSNQS